MDEFARGARIRLKPPETPLTLNQAAYVCCEIAGKQGMQRTEFLVHMMRAYVAWRLVTGNTDTGDKKP